MCNKEHFCRHIIKYGTVVFIVCFLSVSYFNYKNVVKNVQEGIFTPDMLIRSEMYVCGIISIFCALIGFILNKYHLKIFEMSIKDALTGLYNRSFLNALLETELGRRDTDKKTSLLMLDIDYFKLFNDTYGHIEGDKCLKKVAKCLQHAAKRNSDIVVRFGGEEFLILLLDTEVDVAEVIAQNIHDCIKNLVITHSASNTKLLTLSIGIVEIVHCNKCDKYLNKPEVVVDHADKALYAAKENGRNQTVIYSEAHKHRKDVKP